jgi:sigma-54 dependent transcriptional regulator, acetoin dehydrogenase operon transcriptional activator AcoR
MQDLHRETEQPRAAGNAHEINEDPAALWNLEEIEKNTILKAMDHFGHNISRMAEALGLSRNTLYLKLKKFGIRQDG